MNPNFEGPKITNPQEELSRLREVAVQHAERAKEGGIEMTPHQASQETVKQYAATPPHEVLHPEYTMKEHEAEAITLELSPETHNRQLEQFTRKLKSPFVSINIRVVASAATQGEADGILHDLESSFNQFENGHGNRIEWNKVEKRKLEDLISRPNGAELKSQMRVSPRLVRML